MTKQELFEHFRQLLEETPVGILATNNPEGFPSVRYMTVCLLPGQDTSLYALTAKTFAKTAQVQQYPLVTWFFYTENRTEVFSFRGKTSVNENPRFKSELLEIFGGYLETFWKLNHDPSNLVCLQTDLISVEYFRPSEAKKVRLSFEERT